MEREKTPEKRLSSLSQKGAKARDDLMKLLQENPDLNPNATSGKSLFTALHESCDSGNLDAVRILVGIPGIDVNQQEREGGTPLFYAARRNRPEVVEFLLRDERVDLNKPAFLGQLPLHAACENKYLEIVKLFLASGRRIVLDKPTIETNGKPAKTPLQIAASAEVVELLTRYIENPKEVIKELRGSKPVRKLEKELGVLLSDAARFPEEFSTLGDISDLSLADSLLEVVPNKLAEMTSLVSLSLAGNSISVLPNFMGTFLRLAALNLSYNKLSSLPEFIGNCVGLEKLNVKGNQLSTLPASMAKLTKLVKLDLSENLFEAVPDSISKLPIAYLKLNRNKITALPGWLPQNKHITELNLNGNTGININEAVPFLANVKILHAKACEITEISNEFCSLTQLTSLNLSANKIGVLPGAFSKLTNLTNLKLRGENEIIGHKIAGSTQLSAQAATILARLIRVSKRLKKLNILRCNIGPEGAHALGLAMVQCYENGGSPLAKLEVDPIKLEDTTGMDIIPLDIRQREIDEIARFMVDFFRSPRAPPIYRSKVMVVGYESIGKTSVIDCIFVHSGFLELKESNRWRRYWFEIQGRYLRQYSSPDDKATPLRTITLEKNKNTKNAKNPKWDATRNLPSSDVIGFTLHKTAGETTLESYEFKCRDHADREAWVNRLRRETWNEATHGIEIHNHVIDHPLAKDVVPEGSKLEVSVWDFAGQHDYYNNHHYFLQARTVFLVLWNMSKEEDGLKSLEFWLRSLAIHLPKEQHDGKLFSVLVVGTFLDKLSEIDQEEDQKLVREDKIKDIALASGLNCTIECHEVSCHDLTNIENLTTSIVRNVLTHSYMGECIPLTYLIIQEVIKELREKYRPSDHSSTSHSRPSTPPATPITPQTPNEGKHLDLPIIELTELIEKARAKSQQPTNLTESLTKRALKLLFAWGDCVYFDNSDGYATDEQKQEVSNIVIFDPTFLTKNVLANLFWPSVKKSLVNGVLQHKHLNLVWAKYIDHAPALLVLMEKFEVCFCLPGERSLIPSLLPETPPANFGDIWPEKCPSTFAGENSRVISFNVVPKEMISRLIIRFHKSKELMTEPGNQTLWRYGFFLVHKQTQALVEVKITEEDKGLPASSHSEKGPAELQNQDRFQPSGQLFVTIRGNKPRQRKELMETIVNAIATAAEGYPGVIMHQFVRSPTDPNVFVNLVEILADGVRGEDDRQLVCPKTKCSLIAEELLATAGVIVVESSEEKQEAVAKGLPDGIDLLKRLREDIREDVRHIVREETHQIVHEEIRQIVREELSISEKNLLSNAQEIIRHSYPTAFLLLPIDPDSGNANSSGTVLGCLRKLKTKAERLIFDKSQLHCLCEVRIRDQNGQMQACWHPTDKEGVQLQEVAEFVKKFGPALKATMMVLQAVGVGVRLGGLPFPNIGEITDLLSSYAFKSSSVLRQIKGEFVGVQGLTDDQILAKMKADGPGSLELKGLEGDSLNSMKKYFGEEGAGYLTKAGLRRRIVLHNGPMGDAGDVLWLCDTHSEILDLQDKQQLAETKKRLAESYALFWKSDSSN